MSVKLEVYKDDDITDNKTKCIAKGLPQPVFRWVMIGSTGCGKTNLIKNVLFNDTWGYNQYFDEIYIFSGSADDCERYAKKTTESGMEDYVMVRQKFECDEVRELIADMETGGDNDCDHKRILFVLDDQICNDVSKPCKPTVLDELFIRGRHIGISVIIASQKYMALNQNIRQLNNSHLTIFNNTSQRDLKTIAKEHCNSKNEDEFYDMLVESISKPYSFITLDRLGNAIVI